jgi:membrane fusion protein, multidrug efflux system
MKRAILYICFLLFLPLGCRNNTIQSPKTEITRVRVVSITPEDVSLSVHSSGILASEEEIKLSFKTAGIVSEINVKEGDKAKKGDILASLNLSEINANVDLARNGYEKAQRDWNRAKNLYSDTVATLEQYQNATTALNVAKSNLEIARFNLAHSTIKAPSDGVILKQLVKENELIGAGYPVFLFGAKGKFWKVKTGLADRDIVSINPGDSAVVIFDAWPGVKFPAIVDLVSEMASPMTGTYETEMSLDGMGYRLASGFIADVDIFPAKRKTFILVPVGAVVGADGDKGFIWSVSDSATAQKHEIKIASIKGSDAVVTGVPEGVREIVSEGAAYLKEGMRVEIIK